MRVSGASGGVAEGADCSRLTWRPHGHKHVPQLAAPPPQHTHSLTEALLTLPVKPKASVFQPLNSTDAVRASPLGDLELLTSPPQCFEYKLQCMNLTFYMK